jgi:hypothetical protein
MSATGIRPAEGASRNTPIGRSPATYPQSEPEEGLGPTFDRSVDLRIMRLRKKIEPDPDHPRFIRTVRNEGYIFVPDGEKTT